MRDERRWLAAAGAAIWITSCVTIQVMGPSVPEGKVSTFRPHAGTNTLAPLPGYRAVLLFKKVESVAGVHSYVFWAGAGQGAGLTPAVTFDGGDMDLLRFDIPVGGSIAYGDLQLLLRSGGADAGVLPREPGTIVIRP
jgi:hypothetical protein